MERFFVLVAVLVAFAACSSSKNGGTDADETSLPDEVSDTLLPDHDTVVAADDLVDDAEEEENDLAVSEDDTVVSEENMFSDADILPADDDATQPDDDTVTHTLTITEPANNSSHPAGEPVHFAGTTTCFPATVSFIADGQWPLGSVQTTTGAFAHDYAFNTPGPARVITATATGSGCSASGSVTITITAATPDNPLDVPYFCQYENTLEPGSTCQNTSVAMVLKHYGWDGMPDTITAEWGKDSPQSPSGLAEVFNYFLTEEALGVSLTPHTNGSFAGLRALLDAGKPVIVHGYFTQYGHVVVTVGYDATGYFVNDPAGQWSEVYQGGYSKYCDYGYSGKAVHYGKATFEQAIGPDNTIWYHEITP